MLQTLLYRITPFDYLLRKPPSGALGWAGPFPPERNGAAAVTYWTVRALLAQKFPVAACPPSPYVIRKYFPGITYARISSNTLKALLYVCADDYFARTHHHARCPTLAWQTVHKPLDEVPAEMNTFQTNQHADHIILPTRFAHKEYKRHGADNTSYVPFGVDTTLFRPAANHKNFTVLFVSRLCYYKGIVQFLEAIPHVLQENPHIRFHIVGQLDHNPRHFRYQNTDDPIKLVQKKLNDALRQHPHNLVHTPWIPFSRTSEIYQQADILVMPSCSEGFGVPLIEAMSCGVPVITTDLPPLNEIVLHKRTGFCLPPNTANTFSLPLPSAQDIAEHILRLANNPELHHKLSIAARTHAQRHYDMQTVAKNLINTISSVTQSATSTQT